MREGKDYVSFFKSLPSIILHSSNWVSLHDNRILREAQSYVCRPKKPFRSGSNPASLKRNKQGAKSSTKGGESVLKVVRSVAVQGQTLGFPEVDKINTVKATSEWTFPPIRAIARSVRNEEKTDGGQ